MARRSGTILGPILIVVGLLLLLSRLGVPAFSYLWPFLILAVGAGMLLRYFQSKQDSGLVFTGTLLVLIGGLFQIDQWFGLDFGDNWPFFVLAPGIALLAMALVDRDRRDALLPAGILIALALVFYLFSSGLLQNVFRAIWAVVKVIVQIGVPLGLMAVGAWLIFGRKERLGGAGNEFPEKYEPDRPVGGWPGTAPHAPAPPPRQPAVVEDAVLEPANEPEADSAAAPEEPVPASVEESVEEPAVEEPPVEEPAAEEPAAWRKRDRTDPSVSGDEAIDEENGSEGDRGGAEDGDERPGNTE
jgi:hypothetical protein